MAVMGSRPQVVEGCHVPCAGQQLGQRTGACLSGAPVDGAGSPIFLRGEEGVALERVLDLDNGSSCYSADDRPQSQGIIETSGSTRTAMQEERSGSRITTGGVVCMMICGVSSSRGKGGASGTLIHLNPRRLCLPRILDGQ